jgi:hypothetical protein
VPLFHSSPVKLAPDSIILPGNFGRIIKHTGNSHPLWQREMLLERIRATSYPTKPSRLDACFACVNEQALRFYVNAMDQNSPGSMWPVLYEVEKTELDAPEHRADFNVVRPLPRLDKTAEEIAHHYWTASLWITIADAPEIRCEELITTSPLRILHQFS